MHLGQVVQNRFLGLGQKAGKHCMPFRFDKSLQCPGVIAFYQCCQLKSKFAAEAAHLEALNPQGTEKGILLEVAQNCG